MQSTVSFPVDIISIANYFAINFNSITLFNKVWNHFHFISNNLQLFCKYFTQTLRSTYSSIRNLRHQFRGSIQAIILSLQYGTRTVLDSIHNRNISWFSYSQKKIFFFTFQSKNFFINSLDSFPTFLRFSYYLGRKFQRFGYNSK